MVKKKWGKWWSGGGILIRGDGKLTVVCESGKGT